MHIAFLSCGIAFPSKWVIAGCMAGDECLPTPLALVEGRRNILETSVGLALGIIHLSTLEPIWRVKRWPTIYLSVEANR
jgi:hypothetical protein